MDQPIFLAGNEQLFFSFISKLNENDKIALVSHGGDLDGLASAKIVDAVVSGLFEVY